MFIRKAFYDALRGTTLFNGFTPEQVVGIEALLDACQKWKVTDTQHVANIFAQVFHETGEHMSPIKETVQASHKDKNPTDAVVIQRLDTAWKAGKLPWVNEPYWRDGWFGRGQVQITHKGNYDKLGKAIGVDLINDPNKALLPFISADIAVVGMTRGLFTGKKLADYQFPADLLNPPAKNPRRIINGKDGTDSKIANFHKVFYYALAKAGWSITDSPPASPTPVRTQAVILAEIRTLIDELSSLGG
jgi:predicted chitinase